jgi:nucleotidyltransferase substrate binding protein (TIGR01987 family)
MDDKIMNNHDVRWMQRFNNYKLALSQLNSSVKTAEQRAFREAFNKGIIEDGQVWMDMIDDRNLTAHTYDESTKNKVIGNILADYYNAFNVFTAKMEEVK